MKAGKIVLSNDSPMEEVPFLAGDFPSNFEERIDWHILSVHSRDFRTRREANKIANDYAVTEFPFILLLDEDGVEYAALYSEEGPITIDRIKNVL